MELRHTATLTALASVLACQPIPGPGSSDPPPSPVYCGDGKSRGSEVCDRDDLEDASCESQGLGAGRLGCMADCRGFDLSGCGAPATCGNGQVDGVEACEGSDLNGQSCETLGYGPGHLICLSNCADYDRSGCSAPPGCGDGVKNGTELCDGQDFGALSCSRLGLGQGELVCSSKCDGIDESGCRPAQVDAGQEAGPGLDAAQPQDAAPDRWTPPPVDAALARDARSQADRWAPSPVDAAVPPDDGSVGQDHAQPPAAMLINEFVANAAGTDADPGNNLFIELWGPANHSLSGYLLQGVNGGNGSVYATIDLSGQTTGANGYFLIAHPSGDSAIVALADMLDSSVDLQNGPDSLLLVHGSIVVDAVGYGSFGPADSFAGEGQAVTSPAPGASLSRDADHSDSDDNRVDFGARDVPTPTGGAGAPSCTHQCPSVGATQCQGDLEQSCQVQSDGCRGWDPAQACPGAGQTCQGSQCTAPVCQTRADCQPGEGCAAGHCLWLGEASCFDDVDCGRDWTCSASRLCMNVACLVKADCRDGQACQSHACVSIPSGTACQSDAQCGYHQLCTDQTCSSASCGYRTCPVGARCVSNWCERVAENSPCLSWSDCGYSQLCQSGQCVTQTIVNDCSHYMCNQICTPYNIGSERYVCANGHCIDMDSEPCQQDSDCSRWEYCGIPYPRDGQTSTCRDNFNYGRPFNFSCPYCVHGYECQGASLSCSSNGLMKKWCAWVELGSPCQTNASSCGEGRICISTDGGLDGTCEEWDGTSCPNGSTDCPHSYSCVGGSCVSRVGIPCDYNYQCGNGDCCVRSGSTYNFCGDAVVNERACVP